MFRKFHDETYDLRTMSTRRLWFNALVFPCVIVLGIFLIADTYESQRILESRGVVVDAVVVEHENRLQLEILAKGGGQARYVASPDDALAVGDVVTIRYDPRDPTNFAPTMDTQLGGLMVLFGAVLTIMAGLWLFQTVELIGRRAGRRKRQPRNLGCNPNPRSTD
ncbi:DUF3592 domain-containing protein [Promicromonospora panici]|uniref:DUF3592 domain-containing protein n=1 Tax=Promicromonospora panici TaxID=2219658 RepID=UPI00101BEC31|nr:DUF3592 domain-containing protein [Promicromonospora panici]